MHKLTAQRTSNRAIAGILFTPTKMVATDGFRLLEVTKTINGVVAPTVMRATGFTGKGDVHIDLTDPAAAVQPQPWQRAI